MLFDLQKICRLVFFLLHSSVVVLNLDISERAKFFVEFFCSELLIEANKFCKLDDELRYLAGQDA